MIRRPPGALHSISDLVALQNPKLLVRQVGRRISELRHEARFTQEAFAERLAGVGSVRQSDRGVGENLTIETMVKIANVLGVPVTDLLRAPRITKPAKHGIGRPRRSA